MITPAWSDGQRSVPGSRMLGWLPVSTPRTALTGTGSVPRASTRSNRRFEPGGIGIVDGLRQRSGEARPGLGAERGPLVGVPGSGQPLIGGIPGYPVAGARLRRRRIGVAVADQHHRPVGGGRQVRDQFLGLSQGEVGHLRLQMGGDEAEPIAVPLQVRPRVSPDVGVRQPAEVDPRVGRRSGPLPRSRTRNPASERTRMTSRRVSRTSRASSIDLGVQVAGKGWRLDVGRLLHLHHVIAEPAPEQLGLQRLQEVLVDLGRIGATGEHELHRALPPQRHLLQPDHIRAGRRRSPPPAAGSGCRSRCGRRSRAPPGSPARGRPAPPRPADPPTASIRPVEIGAQVEVAGHHGDGHRPAGPGSRDHDGDDDDHGDHDPHPESKEEAGPGLHQAIMHREVSGGGPQNLDRARSGESRCIRSVPTRFFPR